MSRRPQSVATPGAYLRDAVRQLVCRKCGSLPDDVTFDRFSFDPSY